MIARLLFLVPYRLVIPESETFTIFTYEDRGYGVAVYPPQKSDRPTTPDTPEEIRVDGVRAIDADVIRIDFLKSSFDRRDGLFCDPPFDVIRDAIASFITRIRHATRAAHIRPFNEFPIGTWRITYLNDDGSELEKAEGFVRLRGALRFSYSFTAVNRAVWAGIHDLPPDYQPPPWEELLLDAQADLPRIGPAIVLAATALEVFITRKLDELAKLKEVPQELWTWINDRGTYLREPTIEEQYDVLLRFLTGHSLKTEALWESFQNLKSARNSFVHEGVAKLGGAPVSVEVAEKWVTAARDVISKVREWLPPELHWPLFNFHVNMEIQHRIPSGAPRSHTTTHAPEGPPQVGPS